MEEEARKALCRQSQAERELEKAHEKISKLQSDLSSAKSAMDRSFQLLYYIMVILIKDCHDIYNRFLKGKRVLEAIAFDSVDKLQKLCVLRIFRHRLQKVRELGYNEEIIYDLLDAQAMVFQWHKHERKDIEIAILRNELAYTAWERDKLAFYHGLDEQDKIMSQREEFFLAAMAQNIPVNIRQNITIRREVSKGRTKDLLLKYYEIFINYLFKYINWYFYLLFRFIIICVRKCFKKINVITLVSSPSQYKVRFFHL